MSENTAVIKTGNLSVHHAAAACYLPVMSINFLASVAFLVLEPRENTEIRFHAAQSLMVQALVVGLVVVGVVLWLVLSVVAGLIDTNLGMLVNFGMLLLVVTVSLLGALGMFALTALAAMEKSPRIPVLGGFAAKFSGHEA